MVFNNEDLIEFFELEYEESYSDEEIERQRKNGFINLAYTEDENGTPIQVTYYPHDEIVTKKVNGIKTVEIDACSTVLDFDELIGIE
ncbi:hypothetical protein [Abyssicoccus albus]|uniref:Uncharacterized protein n=1 Tax=Abyssicoccus albus TaxID=1817405 RepID=A0A3N5BY73_9BACL|nr:hypothetical protein [Abyssicoccus albus]RPF54748.1 hypothetical protein EDD62_1708 [Abyssicoccus albus]